MKHLHKVAVRAGSRPVGQTAHATKRTLCRIVPALLAITGLFCAGPVARAGTVVNVHGQNPHATPTSGTGVRLYEGGAFDFKVNNPSSPQFMGSGGAFRSTGIVSNGFDLTQYIKYGPAQSSGPNVGGTRTASARVAQELWGKHINNVLKPPAGLTTSQAAGAFQQAIWKHEYDGKASFGAPGSVNFGAGHVETTATNAGDATVLNTSGSWINSLSFNHSSGELTNLGGDNYQDHGGHVNQIVTPEPSSNLIWLIVAAIGVYPIMRRRSSAA